MQLAAFYRNQFSLGYAAMLVNESMPQFIADRLASQCDLPKRPSVFWAWLLRPTLTTRGLRSVTS